MNVFGWVLLAAVAGAGVACVGAVAQGRPSIGRALAAPYVVLLLAFALLVHAESAPAGRWVLLTLVLFGIAVGVRRGTGGPGRRSPLLLPVALEAAGVLAALVATVTLPERPSRLLGAVAVVLLGVLAAGWVARTGGLADRLRVALATYVVLLVVTGVVAFVRGHPSVGLGVTAQVVAVAVERSGRDGGPVPAVATALRLVALLLVVLGLLRPDLFS